MDIDTWEVQSRIYQACCVVFKCFASTLFGQFWAHAKISLVLPENTIRSHNSLHCQIVGNILHKSTTRYDVIGALMRVQFAAPPHCFASRLMTVCFVSAIASKENMTLIATDPVPKIEH